jgi:hypothetical protein
MKGCWRYWGFGLALGSIVLLGLGAGSLQADGMARKRPRGNDYQVFLVELAAGGAFKFYADSEDILRSGDFEQAFSRYLFLASHIRGQSLYTGLAASVNRRLHFLMGQLGLGEESLRYARTTRRLPPPPPPPKPEPKAEAKPAPAPKVTEDQEPPPPAAPAAPPAPPVPSPAAPPAGASPGAKPGEVVIPPVIVDEQIPLPGKPQGSPAQETAKALEAGEKSEAKVEKALEQPPPPGAWDKVKRRLKFW